MKIAVVGATGPTGLLVISQALEKAIDVVALVRNPSKIQTNHEKLTVEKTDIFSPDKVKEHFSGCDAVISCIGTGLGFSTVNVYSDAVKSIVPAMRECNVKRIFCVSSWYSKYTSEEPWMFRWVVKPLLLGRVCADMDRMETFLKEDCSDIDYTVVRCPQLTNGPLSGKDVIAVEGMSVPNGSYLIPRADVAAFLLKALEDGTYKQKLLSIGLPK